MPESFRELLNQDFSPLGRAVTSWRRLGEACRTAHDTSTARVSAPLEEAGWEGEAARSGLHAMRVTRSMLLTAQRNVLLIAGVMHHARVGMQAAQERLRNTVAEAEEAGHRVTPSGTVEPRATSPAYRNLPDEDMALRDAEEVAAFRDRIAAALQEAHDASGEAWRALREIDWFTLDKEYGAQSVEEAGERITGDIGIGFGESDIPTGESAERAAAWWSHLNAVDRELLLAAHPLEIGALDGLPAHIRDQANRAALTAQLDEYRLNERSLGIHDEIIHSGLTRLQSTLDARADAPEAERLYLLGFGTGQDGRAIVAEGNPDTAAHTAVMVPGTGNDLHNFPSLLNRSSAMRAAAEDQERGSVAVISWLGYDAPELSDSVLTRERAEDGAADLRDLTAGLRAAYEKESGHLTVIGHSYGSTTVGAADGSGRGLGADDVIVVGSPGLTVDRADDLHVSPDHLWVGAAEDDLVSNHLSGLTLGAAPQEPAFGARTMPVDTSGHSGYWTGGSQSLENMGRIIAGDRPLNEVREP
ncbi:alpha/beta hydrolase [Streptomyces sp. MS19]|uniref:alpha/beta hydrolase n=1 Tax=Streptomyces sp. MS19 TaxID=3385972 RepID=UPI0039A1DD59